MKYLKGYKIFESLEQKDNKFWTFRGGIHKLCKDYNISNYTINDDGSIDVRGNVVLANLRLTKLPLKFRNVSGDFSCGDNQLRTLEGCPQSVGGDFFCYNNQLTTLEGAPQSVGGNFFCYNNQLKTLEGAPQSVGGRFSCRDNQLTTLEGTPQSVGGDFYCGNNQLKTLEGGPQSVGGDFSCHNNPVNLIIHDWIDRDDRDELIRYFLDLDVIQDDKLIMDRLKDFHLDIGVEIDIDFNEVKKYYTIIE
jgi:hypothetical protein